jgi:hypothetical protein
MRRRVDEMETKTAAAEAAAARAAELLGDGEGSLVRAFEARIRQHPVVIKKRSLAFDDILEVLRATSKACATAKRPIDSYSAVNVLFAIHICMHHLRHALVALSRSSHRLKRKSRGCRSQPAPGVPRIGRLVKDSKVISVRYSCDTRAHPAGAS